MNKRILELALAGLQAEVTRRILASMQKKLMIDTSDTEVFELGGSIRRDIEVVFHSDQLALKLFNEDQKAAFSRALKFAATTLWIN